MKQTLSIEKIKRELIKSCVEINPKSFIPYLLASNVSTGMPNKTRFYRFFKEMVICLKENSKGNLYFKIENEKTCNSENTYFLNFYDEVHLHSRLSIEIRENKQQIYLDTLPF